MQCTFNDWEYLSPKTWWRHQMETFSASLAICAGNSPVTGEFPAQRPVMRSFDVFFSLRLNERLRKQWWGWWFETPSRPLRRHCNDSEKTPHKSSVRVRYWDVFCEFIVWTNLMIFPSVLCSISCYIRRRYIESLLYWVTCNSIRPDAHGWFAIVC